MISEDDMRGLSLAPMPHGVMKLLGEVGAPPRLVAHLALVHDVATRLIDAIARAFPGIAIAGNDVLFGAATHDIGKAVARNELTEPGTTHEQLGQRLLVSRGIRPELARFAVTHADLLLPNVTLEDAIVALADKVWKGKRDEVVEDAVLTRLTAQLALSKWEAYDRLDGIINDITDGADRRLEFQARFEP